MNRFSIYRNCPVRRSFFDQSLRGCNRYRIIGSWPIPINTNNAPKSLRVGRKAKQTIAFLRCSIGSQRGYANKRRTLASYINGRFPHSHCRL